MAAAPTREHIFTASHRIAVLVPLSGVQKELGEALLNAATLALNDVNDNRTELLPLDTADPQAMTHDALTRFFGTRLSAVIGPLTAADVARIRPYKGEVPVLSFSNDSNAAGDGVFVAGFRPEDQIEHVLKYAQSQHRVQSLALLTPNTHYGHTLQALVRRIVPVLGIHIALADTYDSQHISLLKTVAPLKTTPHDALFLPEGGQTLQALVSTLLEQGYPVGAAQIIGMDAWRQGSVAGLAHVQGGLFAALPTEHRPHFEHSYRAAFHATPPALSTLGYDLATLAIRLCQAQAHRTGSSTPLSAASLLKREGFSGVTGLFRFRPTGINQRSYDVFRVSQGGPLRVKPALAAFPN